jgi:hypothetical protein
MNDEHDMNPTWTASGPSHLGFASPEGVDDNSPVDDDNTQLRISQRPISSDKYIAYTIKLPAHQLAALQSIWLELKRLYGAHSPDKSGMIQHGIEEWLKRWDGPDRNQLLDSLLQIRADTRRRQYKKSP